MRFYTACDTIAFVGPYGDTVMVVREQKNNRVVLRPETILKSGKYNLSRSAATVSDAFRGQVILFFLHLEYDNGRHHHGAPCNLQGLEGFA